MCEKYLKDIARGLIFDFSSNNSDIIFCGLSIAEELLKQGICNKSLKEEILYEF